MVTDSMGDMFWEGKRTGNFYFYSLFFLIYLFCEREHKLSGGEEQGERQRERIPGRLHNASAEPDVGLQLMNHEIVTQAEIKSWMLHRLSHPGAPRWRVL